MALRLAKFNPHFLASESKASRQPETLRDVVLRHLVGYWRKHHLFVVAEVALHVVFHGEAVAAHDFHSVAGRQFRGAASHDLGHARLDVVSFAGVAQPGALVDKVLGIFDLNGDVGEKVLQDLKRADGLPERPSFPRILQGILKGGFRDCQRKYRGSDTLRIQHAQESVPTFVLFSQQVFERHANVVKVDLVYAAAVDAHFLDRSDRDTLAASINDQKRQPFLALHVLIANDKGREEVSDVGPADPHLRAVHDEVIAVFCRRRADGAENIRTAGRLRHGQRPLLLARSDSGQVTFLLGIGAQGHDRTSPEAVGESRAETHRHARLADFLDDNAMLDFAESHSSVLGRNANTHGSQLRKLLVLVLGKKRRVLVEPANVFASEVPLAELAIGLLQELLFFSEFQVHRRSPFTYLPLKLGFLFSTKAATPSFMSSEPASHWIVPRSMASAASMLAHVAELLMMVFAARSANGGFAASSSTVFSSAWYISARLGNTRLTKPHCCASEALIASPR